MAEVDLARLARAYDFRNDDGVQSRIAEMLATADIGPGDRVLDVGGGRGLQAGPCRATGAEVVLVDPSPLMVRYALDHNPGLLGVIGRGEALPFSADTADLFFFHLSIHHGDWKAMLDEAWRVIRPGGSVWVWTTTDAHHRASFLTRWFPSVGEIDTHRFPPVAGLEEHLASRGAPGATVLRREVMSRAAANWVDAVEAGFVSTLHLVEQSEIDTGLERFRAAHPDPSEMVEYELHYAGVWCRRPR